MMVLQVLFWKLEMILFPMIFVFLMNKVLNLSARSSAELTCGSFTFELLPFRLSPLIFYHIPLSLWNKNTQILEY